MIDENLTSPAERTAAATAARTHPDQRDTTVDRSVMAESKTTRRNVGDRPLTLAVVPLDPAAISDVTELVEQHLSLVGVLVAQRLRDVPVHIRRDDLVSAGMLALVLSAGAYDPGRGVPFQGFAACRIRGALIDELRTMDWASRSVRSRAREVQTIRTLLTTALDRQPDTNEIANAMGISTRELEAVHADLARGTVLSLQGISADARIDISTNDTCCPESIILHREQLGYLHDAVAALPERLRFVVVAYYFGRRQMSDIAVEISVTQSRVSQMCTEAISLLRDGLNSQLDPDTLRPQPQTRRAAATRNAYYQALADRSTTASRLSISTVLGEMQRGVHDEDVEVAQRSRIA